MRPATATLVVQSTQRNGTESSQATHCTQILNCREPCAQRIFEKCLARLSRPYGNAFGKYTVAKIGLPTTQNFEHSVAQMNGQGEKPKPLLD